MGYKNVSPTLRKGRRIGYKGLNLSSDFISKEKVVASGAGNREVASISPSVSTSISCDNPFKDLKNSVALGKAQPIFQTRNGETMDGKILLRRGNK